MTPSSRAEARAMGAKSYFNGQPCLNSHVALRRTDTGSCMECRKIQSKRWRTVGRVSSDDLIRGKDLPNLELLNKRFIADFHNGVLYWKSIKEFTKEDKIFNSLHSGAIVGHLNKTTNYTEVRLENKLYKLHRILFKMYYKHEPTILDHIDRDRNNNSISNLRECTAKENSLNRGSK